MRAANIPVVMYHSVNDHPSAQPLRHLSVTSVEFESHLRALVSMGFEFLTMRELWDLGRTGGLGIRRVAVLTFDDGYLDNWLVAQPILEAVGAKATVFVNPSFITDGAIRTPGDAFEAWGYLNWQELARMEASGLFDIQSHTLTHDHIFTGDRIVDVYRSDDFRKYYWLIRLLMPGTKAKWQGDVQQFASLVPDGFPIFEHGRALSGKRFIPHDDIVARCVATYEMGGVEEVLRLNSQVGPKGRFESAAEYRSRLQDELAGSKQTLEARLGHPVEIVCFPGGAYTEEALQHAARAGYKVYFLSSKDTAVVDNRAAIGTGALAPSGMIGLKRIGFSRNYPRSLFRSSTAYWNAKLKLHSFLGSSPVEPLLGAARSMRNGLHHLAAR